MSKEYENQNVSYVIHGNYQLPCITTKEQNELHIGVCGLIVIGNILNNIIVLNTTIC